MLGRLATIGWTREVGLFPEEGIILQYFSLLKRARLGYWCDRLKGFWQGGTLKLPVEKGGWRSVMDRLSEGRGGW